jgi:SAM-dependent methyltransferase
MERIIYDRMADLDSRHWWYRARREVLAKLIARKIARPRGADPGDRLRDRPQSGDARPVRRGGGGRAGRGGAGDRDPAAGRPVAEARLPELAGVPEHSYDMVALLDVLEHVEDDRAALASIARRLKPGGALLITVPAFPVDVERP